MTKPKCLMYPSSAQKDIWNEEAEELGLSKSDYYIQMVQAGRREFDLQDLEHTGDRPASLEGRSDNVETRIREVLDEDEATSFDEIVDHVVGSLKQEIDEYLREAPDVEHSPVRGGYYLTTQ